MSETDINKIKKQMNRVLSVIDPAYVEALLLLHKLLEKSHIEWVVGGELGEALKTVQVEPECIEIITSKEGAEEIFSLVKKCIPKEIDHLTNKLARNATINGMEHPIYVRSYHFEFSLNQVKINVNGDMQYKINNWNWGDKLEFIPEHVNVTGVKIAVAPLELKRALYQGIGWTDRSEKIDQVINRRSKCQNE